MSYVFLVLHIINLICSIVRFTKIRYLVSSLEMLIPVVGLISAILMITAVNPLVTYIAFMGLFCTSAIKIAPALIRNDISLNKLWNNITKYTLVANGIIELILIIVASLILL